MAAAVLWSIGRELDVDGVVQRASAMAGWRGGGGSPAEPTGVATVSRHDAQLNISGVGASLGPGNNEISRPRRRGGSLAVAMPQCSLGQMAAR